MVHYWESKSSAKKSSKNNRQSPGKRSIVMGGSVKDYPFLRNFYRHKVVIGDNIQKFIFVMIIAALLYTFVLGDGGVVRILLLKHKTAELEQDLASLELDLELLKSEIDHLKNDPFYMEKIGRERFGYLKPGDRVLKIVPQDKDKKALDE
ncbi:MAG: septum formation initiator family protein [Candidatus Latescibacterota bacterium]